MTRAPYRSSVTSKGDGFARLVLAEWTKFRSVRRWSLIALGAVVATVVIAMLAASDGQHEQSSDGPARDTPARETRGDVQDRGQFVHRPLVGDGSITVRVSDQLNSAEWAKAGLVIRGSTRPGTEYAAVVLTPEHGVRMQWNYTHDKAGGRATAPVWLRLTRSGDTVTGYRSADGADWRALGTVHLDGLPDTVRAGLLVASPEVVEVQRQFGSESIDGRSSIGRATFDGLRLDPDSDEPWQATAPDGPTSIDGPVTVEGAGDVGRYDFAEDPTRTVLTGVLVGLMAMVTLAVLFVTSEYRRRMIWATFCASPRRGRVLAAKAVVLGGVTFVAGLVSALGAVALAAPIMRSKGMPAPDLADGPVLRAVVGTGLLLALVAAFSLGVATVLRRSSGAIALVLVLLLVPQIVASGMPLSAAKWLERVTPAAGFAVQQSVHRYDTALGPWTGLAVLGGYAALALGLATWRLRGRDA